ncbi:hypothetical protein RJ640_016612 [Escallonia rubra]|uniref:Transposase (putative) gypsy type domain-containing protein n=1 Tax=Escallonia rubra TaxID=112253 RepID=A0AA88RQ15_9ASTE|nr:hypothetical protein RJ640_016612 [Escallonia rubra]
MHTKLPTSRKPGSNLTYSSTDLSPKPSDDCHPFTEPPTDSSACPPLHTGDESNGVFPYHHYPSTLTNPKDQAEDKANPKPWYTADEKSNKMSIKDLLELIREYPLPEGWYARLPGLQEPANYGTKFETGIYEEQVKSGYRLHLHPFALRFFEHYRMALRQLVLNGWRKLVGLIYLVQTSGYKPDVTDFTRVFFKICFVKEVANCPGWYYIHSRQRLLKGRPKSNKGWHSRYFFKWLAEVENRHKEAFLAFSKRPRERGKKNSQMYATRSAMLSRFEMARQVAAEEAQQKRDAIKEEEEATRRAEELSKQEADNLLQIVTLEKRLEEWLKKRMDDGLEIYEMGFTKAKEMFTERFPDIPLDDFVMPAVVSSSGETTMPSEAGDAAASHPPEEGPSGHAPEL